MVAMGTALIKPKKDPAILRMLTDREYRFVFEYVIDLNGARAARDAGYSIRSAPEMAAKMLKKPKIKKALQHLTKNVFRRNRVDADEALLQVFYAATRQVKNFFHDDGSVRHPNDLPDSLQSIVDGIKIEETTDYETGDKTQKIEYKLTPHATAREQALKHLGLLIDRVEHSDRAIVDWDKLYDRDETDNVSSQERTDE